MKRAYLVGLTLLLAIPSSGSAARRNVKEIGLRGMRKGRISTTKPARAVTRLPADANYAPDRLLVRFAPNADLTAPTRAQKERILSPRGISIRREFDLVPGLTVVNLPAGVRVNEETLRRFNAMPGVLYVEPDYQIQIDATPNDPSFGSQWALYNAPWGDNDINAREAWDTETGNDEIVVAVIDTGVNYNHADLDDNMWTNSSSQYGYDWVNDDTNPMDDNGHGTHCAGIVGAEGNNGVNVCGVCWDVRIMALKVFNASGNGYASDALDAIEYATEHGAHVLNCSWRYYSGNGYFNVTVAAMEEALNAAGEANIVVAAAAGNETTNIDVTPCYPPCCNCDNVIVVGATTSAGARANYSNYGATKVDLFAPGSSILSCSLYSGTTYKSGTSMAAPHVAGMCALLLSRNPSLSYEDVKDIIMDNVTSVGSLSGYCVTGGILNAYAAVVDSDTSHIADPPLVGRDPSTNIKAWVDKRGNLVLKGSFQQGQSTNPTPIGGLKIKNSAGTVIASLNTGTGNMEIAGQCYEFCSNLTPTNPNWVVKASDGTVLVYLNSSGNLYMTGEVFDGI